MDTCMSRSGYSDDCDGPELARWRGAVTSAIRGKCGQAFLREMLEALDAMPEKRLISDELVSETGVCALGAVAQKRALVVDGLDIDDPATMGNVFGIARAMAAEIVYQNDEGVYYFESPEHRYARMREWVAGEIRPLG